MALSADGDLLAALGPDASFVLLFDARSLTPHSRMDVPGGFAVSTLAFSPDATELVLTTADMRLERFNLASGKLVGSQADCHKTSCQVGNQSSERGEHIPGAQADQATEGFPTELRRDVLGCEQSGEP